MPLGWPSDLSCEHHGLGPELGRPLAGTACSPSRRLRGVL